MKHIAVLVLALLSGCAPTRPDPAAYCHTRDGGTLVASNPQPCTLDEPAYAQAQADAARRDWRCLAADWGTTAVGLGVGLAEANPLGVGVAVALGAIQHKAVTEKATADGADYPQRIENGVHCGAAVWNAVQIIRVL